MVASLKAPWAACVAVLVAQGVPTATSLTVQVQAPHRDEGARNAGTYDGTDASAHASVHRVQGFDSSLVQRDNQELLISMPSNSLVGLAEVTAYDSAGNVIAALGASMDSTYGGDAFPASRCIDGILTNYCHSERSGGWLKITYPAESIHRIVVTNRQDCCQSRIVGASITLSQGGTTLWSLGEYDAFPGRAQASYDFTLPTPPPTPNPTSAPTPSPTPAQTAPAPAPAPAVSATGDPHLQNIHGERFDLMRPGKAVLIQIPRGQPFEKSLLTVVADARRLGSPCADMYFQSVNITGTWADKVRAGGLTFTAGWSRYETFQGAQGWTTFGPLKVKVVHGRTKQGIKYLNFYVKHLIEVDAAVGGLLGEDDYTEAATPEEGCRKSISLHKKVISNSDVGRAEAIASLA